MHIICTGGYESSNILRFRDKFTSNWVKITLKLNYFRSSLRERILLRGGNCNDLFAATCSGARRGRIGRRRVRRRARPDGRTNAGVDGLQISFVRRSTEGAVSVIEIVLRVRFQHSESELIDL